MWILANAAEVAQHVTQAVLTLLIGGVAVWFAFFRRG